MPVTECIAVYIRLSSEDNDVDGSIKAESNSVSAQRMLINEFIKKQDEFTNCPVVEYVDDGYSGTNFNRPGFQRMMEDAKAGRIKSIVIKDFQDLEEIIWMWGIIWKKSCQSLVFELSQLTMALTVSIPLVLLEE